MSGLTEQEFTCHCCYDVLVKPTTLHCGHSFCRHCLALWWESSGKTECPECRERWEGFPKVNILLRDAVEKLFQADVQRRQKEIQNNPRITQSLLDFQRHGDEASRGAPPGRPRRGTGSFFSGVLTALTCVTVMLLVYHWSSGENHEVLEFKPLSRWTADDVKLWVEHLGAWTSQYRETFHREQVNGRMLTLLEDDDLSRLPYSIDNPTHRRAILQELHRVRTARVKPPQNLWEYKAVNGGKALFLLYALKDSPRLTILYLYLFDYDDGFLPLIHTCCPRRPPHVDHLPSKARVCKENPNWRQWAEFVVKYSVLPYQLLAEFAWDWLSVHYWTSRFVIVNAMLLSLLEACAFWRVWSRREIRMLPQKMWHHLCDPDRRSTSRPLSRWTHTLLVRVCTLQMDPYASYGPLCRTHLLANTEVNELRGTGRLVQCSFERLPCFQAFAGLSFVYDPGAAQPFREMSEDCETRRL
ncbi:bifunctional apoptosis regulator isoform X3 [Electrophorus electricus]|nr:bifunctional apoptosis regulator isoform X3 [Electrophorus electricus]